MEQLAVIELEFYKNRDQSLQAIESRLEEIEEDYLVMPHTYPDEESGTMRVQAGSVEDAVIWKMEMEEVLVKAKNRITNRCNRIVRAFNKLDDDEQEVLGMVYLDDVDYSLAVKGRLLGYPNVEPFKRKIRQTLLKFYRFILQQKKVIRDEKMAAYKQIIADNLEEYMKLKPSRMSETRWKERWQANK
ncbi:hypothetical protein [Campylobacter sp. 1]|uniref:hypothetical protein n=1 Tax=Campylobacter sp. 1 TaxID=2039344 RepID=UPI000BBC2AA7|nr:hypothetical protein [Campylobacter sp. 1]PCH29346.1 hypothetical protein CPH95_03245 [Campylobacter sp. 1]